MTRRSSVRAAAREIYGALAGAKAEAASVAAPSLTLPRKRGRGKKEKAGREQAAHGGGEKEDPPSPSFGGAGAPSHGSAEASLTARVRALYEDSAVPVHEIAAIAGVTERTIYKYAAKGQWRPRYRWMPDGSRPAAFAPVKGAGGRFIRREDKAKPFARGLKATDPAAAARAAAACRQASHLAGVAQAKAEAFKRFEARMRAIEATNRALADYARFRKDCAQTLAKHGAKDPVAERSGEPSKERVRKRRSPPLQGEIERIHLSVVEVALRRWEMLQDAQRTPP